MPSIKASHPSSTPELDALLKNARDNGQLSATTEAGEAVAASDMSIICVGTPSLPSGTLDLSYVRHVSAQIASALESQGKNHLIIFRSTMLPGSTRQFVSELFEPLLKAGRVSVLLLPRIFARGHSGARFP